MADTYLGELCRTGHDHEGSGMSLRYRSGHCTECKKVLGRQYDRERYAKRRANPKFLANAAKYSSENKQRASKLASEKRRENSEWAKTKDRRNTAYQRGRRKTDSQYNALQRLRVRFSNAMIRYGEGKEMTSNEYGIDYIAIIEHLGPCPGDRSEYHIDHIRPLCSFDLTSHDQVREAFSPKNHQWLTAKDNMFKGSTFK